MRTLTDVPALEKKLKHDIEVVVDRLVAREGVQRRLTDSVETALGLAGGLVVVELVDADADDPARERRFSEKRACPNDHELALDEIEPRTFSFNAPYGACPECTGIGFRLEVDLDLVVPDVEKSLRRGGRAVGADLVGVLRAGAHGARGRPRVLHGHAVARAAGAGEEGRAPRPEPPGPRAVQEPLGP